MTAPARSKRDPIPSAPVDTVVVVTGAAPPSPEAIARIPDGAIVIAADGALDHALAVGLQPAGLVGDLDSVSAAGLAWATAHATIDRHDPDKDSTDTELALRMAADLNPRRVVLIGGGERLDHQLAAIGALGHAHLTSVPELEGWWGAQRFVVLHAPGRVTLQLAVGSTLSLLALHGGCSGVAVTGVRWPLADAELAPLVGHGVSNITVEPSVEVRVSSGVLTIVFVDPLTTDTTTDATTDTTTDAATATTPVTTTAAT